MRNPISGVPPRKEPQVSGTAAFSSSFQVRGWGDAGVRLVTTGRLVPLLGCWQTPFRSGKPTCEMIGLRRSHTHDRQVRIFQILWLGTICPLLPSQPPVGLSGRLLFLRGE